MSVTWIYPFYLNNSAPGTFSRDLTWTVGQSVNLKWSTTLDTYSLHLWQQDCYTSAAYSIALINAYDGNGSGTIQYQWQVGPHGASLAECPIFYFLFNPTIVVTSPYFNITAASSTAGAFSNSTANSSAVTSTAATNTSAPSHHSSALPIGLGVGLGIGIPLLLALAFWFGFRTMRHNRNTSYTSGFDMNKMDTSQSYSYATSDAKVPENPQYYDFHQSEHNAALPPTSGPHELGGESRDGLNFANAPKASDRSELFLQ